MDDTNPKVERGEVFSILNKWLFAARQSGKTEAAKEVRKVLNYFESVERERRRT